MPDPYASIAQADRELQERMAGVLELRAADPQQRAMLRTYLSEMQLPRCSDLLAELPGVSEVIGLDPSPIFIEKAQELGKGLPRLSFRTGDGRALPFADASFDVVVFHTTLCHVPEPERTLREAHRVLCAGG